MIRLDRAFIQNPHELYRRLRAEGPVARVVIWALFPPGTGGAHTFSVNATMLMTDPLITPGCAGSGSARPRRPS